MYFWAKITPKRNFWGKLHLHHCCLFIVPYHAWKVEKLSYSRCWNRILPRFDQNSDPLILACVVLDHSQANIAHVTYLRNSFWQIWIKSKLFYSIFCAFLWCKIRGKFFRWIFRYNLASFRATVGPQFAILPRRGFFGKFYSSAFNILIVPFEIL